MKNMNFLVAAYGIVWVGLSGFLWRLSRRQGNLTRRLKALEDSE